MPFNEHNSQIRSKLRTFSNPLKRFMKSKNPREVDSEVENVNHCEIRSLVLEKVDELVNLNSGKKCYIQYREIKIFVKLKRRYLSSLSVSTLNEQSKTKSNTSIYQPEHHLVADVARTRESYQDLSSYFSEDPDEPSTSATNTIVLSTSIFDRDAEGTEPSKTS